MPSPFPGMDPYLEDPAFWTDFHDRFIVYWSDVLNDRLPENYEARVNERTHVVDVATGAEGVPRPDVGIHRGTGGQLGWSDNGGVATLEPVTLPLALFEETRETYIEIRRRPDRTVVAVLELLSPSNKEGKDRQFYLDKRTTYLHQDVHIVELDLLLGGERIPVRGHLPGKDYFLFVSHADRRFDCDVYSWTIRDRLPTLPIPLKAPDGPVLCDFAAIFTTAYDRGRYRRALDYSRPPLAPVREADRAWAAEIAKGAGR